MLPIGTETANKYKEVDGSLRKDGEREHHPEFSSEGVRLRAVRAAVLLRAAGVHESAARSQVRVPE